MKSVNCPACSVLVRDGDKHRAAFSTEPPYLARFERGTGAAPIPWPADLGVDLSRGFRALKVWFTLREHGTSGIGAAALRNVRQAATLAAAVDAAPDLERLAPVPLNIVCFRFRPAGAAAADASFVDQLNRCGDVYS